MYITFGPTNQQPGASAEATYAHVHIQHPQDGLDIYEVAEVLLRPALLAWGYSRESIDKILTTRD